MAELDDIDRQLMAVFQAELEEHLSTLSKGLLALEQEGGQGVAARAEPMAVIFRAAHSLKGAARAVNFTDIESIAHHLEDALTALKSSGQPLGVQDADALLSALDAIRDAMAAHGRGELLPARQWEPLFRQLQAIASAAPAPVVAPARAPAPAPEPGPVPAAEAAPERGGLHGDEIPRGTKPEIPLREPGTGSVSAQTSAPPARALSSPMDETVRVSTAKLDALMDSVGELLVVRMRTEQLLEQVRLVQHRAARWQKQWRRHRPFYSRLRRRPAQDGETDLQPLLEFLARNEQDLAVLTADLEALSGRLSNDRNHLQLVIDDLQTGVRNVRMLPVATLFDLFPRMVRDLARERGKDIALQLDGAATEVDRQALELLKDPLTHLLRNAIDHGIGAPAERQAAGKPRQGVIRLRAEQRGNTLALEVSDDGRGIDLDAVRRSAVERGLLDAQAAAALSEQDAIDLIFHPGLSTAKHVTDLSGRGVGMDVVRRNLEQLRGVIQVATRRGLGTTFTLTLPLTLATSHVLLARVAGETVALPMMNVARVLRVDVERIGSVEGRPSIVAEGRPLPLISLSQVLGLPAAELPLPPGTKILVAVLRSVDRYVALRVDGFLSTQEVVVKPLGRQLRRVRHVAGATILGDGQIVVILNVADLMKTIQARGAQAAPATVAIRDVRRRRLLVADDSITTRTLEKHILENAGYEVRAVADGREAWALLRGDAEMPDVIVSDINMPNMDGIALTEAVKRDPRLARVPIVLVTSLDAPQDRIRGLDAGADAYIVKSSFDQRELLETLERLIG